jgi:hypothetical protein
MACDGIYICPLILVRKSHCPRTNCTREKSPFGIIENTLPFCTLVPVRVLSTSVLNHDLSPLVQR